MASKALYTLRSATVFLPRSNTLLISWVTSVERYTGSGIKSRRGAGPLRGSPYGPAVQSWAPTTNLYFSQNFFRWQAHTARRPSPQILGESRLMGKRGLP